MRVGIDTGGTFTDFVVAHDDGRIETFKIRSDPAQPAAVILEGLRRCGAGKRDEVVHGSTVATNALLERKGARAALVTTAGFEDVIHIGRQNRAQLYELNPAPKKVLAEPELCFGVEERTYFDGAVARTPERLDSLIRKLKRARVESLLSAFSIPTPIRRMSALCVRRWKARLRTSAARTKSAPSSVNMSARPRPS